MPGTTVPMESTGYSGIDNLEVMREAVNYNRYLLGIIRRHAPHPGRTLDFGAGVGQFAIPLRQLSLDVTAVEPDRAMREQLAASGVVTYASAAELPAECFELIYAINVLEHIDDDVGVLRQLHTVLAPQGRLLLYVPAFQLLYTSMDAKVGHVRRYTRATLSTAVAAAGFCIQRVSYVDCLGFPATLLFKLFDRGRGDINRRALKIYDRAVFPCSTLLDVVTRRCFGKNLLLLASR